MVEAGGKADKIILSPNNNTLKCILDIKEANYQIDFAVENSLRRVLGFHAKIYKRGRKLGGYYERQFNCGTLWHN